MTARRPGWLRTIRWIAFVVVAGVAVHVLVPLLAPLEQSLGVARTLPVSLVLAALLCQASSYVGSGALLHSALRLVGASLSVARGVALTLAASSASLVAGGSMGFAASSHRWARASGANAEGAVLAGWLPLLLNGLVQLVTAVLAVSYLIARGELTGTLFASLAGVAALLLALLVLSTLALRRPAAAVRVLTPAVRLWSSARKKRFDPDWSRPHVEVVNGCRRAISSGGWRLPLAASMANLGSDLGCLLFLFLAAGFVPDPGVLIAGWVVPQLARRITFVPGGIGIVEGGMAVFYETLGVPSEVSVVVILLYRAMSFWIPTVAGVPFALYFERDAEAREAGSAAA
jgi:uncharacterized protein (TIRG00374 family)